MGKHKKHTIGDSHVRSIVKSVIYRAMSLTGTTLLSWLVLKDIKAVVMITVTMQVFLMVVYYFYERFWNRLSWGRD